MKSYEIGALIKMFESLGWEESVNPETGVKSMQGNCGFKATKFAGEDATTPNWQKSENSDNEYCFVIGNAKVKNFGNLCRNEDGSPKEQIALLNKKSYDTGEFELGKSFSSLVSFDIENEDGTLCTEFEDAKFVVFENTKTDNDASSDIAKLMEKFMQD